MSTFRVGRLPFVILVNCLAAVFGTAVIDTPFTHYLQPLRASISSALAADGLELACSFALGVLVYLRWRPRAARWVWVPGLILFGVGLTVSGTWTLWAFWDVNKDPGSINAHRVAEWTVFAVPFLRTAGYALGADVCSRAMHRIGQERYGSG
jgi:hypothetical protein